MLKDEKVNGTTKLKLIEKYDEILSLNLIKKNEIDSTLQDYIEKKIQERSEAKKNKDFALADQIRNELLEKNIIIKDTREGTTYEIKE